MVLRPFISRLVQGRAVTCRGKKSANIDGGREIWTLNGDLRVKM